MNQDDAPEFIQKGDYLVAHNCRATKGRDGLGGAEKPLQSTIAKTIGTSETTNVIGGALNDDPNGRVFYFRWSASGNHQILCWSRRLNTNMVVLKNADVTGGLKFLQFSYITGIALIGDYLYWVDGTTNQPRRVDVERALRANNPTYVSPDGIAPVPYTLPLNPWDITVARRVPMYAPKTRKLVSSEEAGVADRAISLTGKSSFQFSYRYKHDTGEYTTLAPFSEVVPPNITRYGYPIGTFDEERGYDTIHVVLDKDEPIDQTVELVEILVRRGNEGSWSIVKTFDRRLEPSDFDNHNTIGSAPMGFYFHNEFDGIPVSDSEAYVPFSDVPIYSQALDTANNRLFMFNNVKGYDSVESPISVEARLSGAATPDLWRIVGAYYLIEWDSGSPIEKVVMRIRSGFGPMSGWYETPYTSTEFNAGTLDLAPTLGTFTKYSIIDDEDNPNELAASINTAPYAITPYTSGPDNVVLGTDWEQYINVARVFRNGYTYKVQTIFYDFAGRNAGVTHEPVEITAPASKYEQDSFLFGIDWELTQLVANIPVWAHSYAIARSRAFERFVAGYFKNPRYANRQADGAYTFTDTAYSTALEGIGLNFEKMVAQGFGYTYSEGDYVVLTDSSEERFTLKVIAAQGQWIVVELADIGDTTAKTFYFELLSPQREAEQQFFEVGRNYKINNPGASNRSFSVINGTIYGDTWLGKRLDGPNYSQPVQAMNPSNTLWSSWPQDYGRVSKLISAKQQRYETDLHPSGPFFPGTETNQLNTFLSGENKQLDLSIGFGQRLVLASRTQEYGTVMLAIGKSEVASIYLGRTEFFNADETPNVLRSTDVIGNVNILKGGFGTINPESCFKNDGDVYWFSAIKSSFVRYAKDGVNPISDKKMSTFAAWLGNLVLTTETSGNQGKPGGIKVVGGFDDFHKEALWAIPPIGNWPIAFDVLDATEDVQVAELTPGSMSAAIIPGEIYRFSMNLSAPVAVNITVWDYHFGQKTFTVTSADPSFMFTGRPGAPATITVASTPPLSAVRYGMKLEKLRPNPYLAVNNVPKTIAFSEESGRWSHTSSHTPEWFSKTGDQLLTFRGGVLFMHDASTVGNFYGVDYPAWISLLFNEQPNTVKRLQGVSLEASAKPSYIHVRTEEPNVQSSDLVASDIETEEGIFSSSILRDRLSPNTPGTVTDKLFRGDEMRGRYSMVLFEWAKSTNFAVRIFNLISRISGGNKT